MKLKFELNGYEIVIEETEDKIISISASKDGEIVEEFELESIEDAQVEPSENEELPESDEEEKIEGDEQNDFDDTIKESKLETFADFLKRK